MLERLGMRHRFPLPHLALLGLLVGRIASADSPLEAYAPFKLVGILPDTKQALLWDEAANEYRVAKIGDTLEGWRVLEVSVRERRVTVGQDEMRDDLVLTRMPRPNALITYAAKAAPASAAARPAGLPTPMATPMATATLPPTAAANDDGPMDPYGAPPNGGAAGGAAAEEPLDPYDAAAPPAAAPVVPAPVIPSQPTVIGDDDQKDERAAPVEKHLIRRADLDREINDFDGLMATVRVAPARGGGFVIVRLEPSSWLAALGLRQGDHVRAIAGEQVSTIDDASRVYARLRSAGSFVVEVQRGPRRVLLRYDVR